MLIHKDIHVYTIYLYVRAVSGSQYYKRDKEANPFLISSLQIS